MRLLDTSTTGTNSPSIDVIKLKPFFPNEDIQSPGFLDFQVYEPSSSPPVCGNYCPCNEDGSTSDCDCDIEMSCDGSFFFNLSASNEIGFHWDAASDEGVDSKYISIQGTDRVRFEFMAEVDCDVDASTYVDIQGGDIEYEIDTEGLDTGSSEGYYVYNPDESFVALGKCDGCSKCEIFTRLQFDPSLVDGGAFDMKFKSLKYSIEYDPANVIQGEQEYEYSTSGYAWIRAGDNTYELLDTPTTTAFAPSSPPSEELLDTPTTTAFAPSSPPGDGGPTSAPTSDGPASSAIWNVFWLSATTLLCFSFVS